MPPTRFSTLLKANDPGSPMSPPFGAVMCQFFAVSPASSVSELPPLPLIVRGAPITVAFTVSFRLEPMKPSNGPVINRTDAPENTG